MPALPVPEAAKVSSLVVRKVSAAEEAAGLVHDAEVFGVEVADGRGAEGGEDARGDVAGAGAHEDSLRRVERWLGRAHGNFLSLVEEERS